MTAAAPSWVFRGYGDAAAMGDAAIDAAAPIPTAIRARGLASSRMTSSFRALLRLQHPLLSKAAG